VDFTPNTLYFVLKAIAFVMKSNTVGVSVTTGRSYIVHFLIKAVYIEANTLQFTAMYKHFGVYNSVAVTEAIVSGPTLRSIRPKSVLFKTDSNLFLLVYFHLDTVAVASGLEAIVCGIKRVVFVRVCVVCVTIYEVFGMRDVVLKINTVLFVQIIYAELIELLMADCFSHVHRVGQMDIPPFFVG